MCGFYQAEWTTRITDRIVSAVNLVRTLEAPMFTKDPWPRTHWPQRTIVSPTINERKVSQRTRYVIARLKT